MAFSASTPYRAHLSPAQARERLGGFAADAHRALGRENIRGVAAMAGCAFLASMMLALVLLFGSWCPPPWSSINRLLGGTQRRGGSLSLLQGKCPRAGGLADSAARFSLLAHGLLFGLLVLLDALATPGSSQSRATLPQPWSGLLCQHHTMFLFACCSIAQTHVASSSTPECPFADTQDCWLCLLHGRPLFCVLWPITSVATICSHTSSAPVISQPM